MGCAAQVSGVARSVGVQRTVQNNGNVKSELKYFGLCKNLQNVLSTFELSLVLSLSWFLRWADFFAFSFSELPAVGCIQHSSIHLAPQNTNVAKGQLRCPPIPPSPRKVVLTSSCNARIRYPARA